MVPTSWVGTIADMVVCKSMKSIGMRRKGIYNRYSFIKRMNRNSIILIRGNKQYISFDRDLDILRYIDFKMEYCYSS